MATPVQRFHGVLLLLRHQTALDELYLFFVRLQGNQLLFNVEVILDDVAAGKLRDRLHEGRDASAVCRVISAPVEELVVKADGMHLHLLHRGGLDDDVHDFLVDLHNSAAISFRALGEDHDGRVDSCFPQETEPAAIIAHLLQAEVDAVPPALVPLIREYKTHRAAEPLPAGDNS